MDKDKGCLEPNLPVTYLECCSILEVSVSGYLAWVQRQKTPTVYKSRSPEALVLGMTKGFLKKQTRDYVPGIRPILSHLQHNGVKVGKERLRRILRSNGIIGRQRRRYKTTTNSEDTKTPFENLLSRQFEPGTLNKVWTSDITSSGLPKAGRMSRPSLTLAAAEFWEPVSRTTWPRQWWWPPLSRL